MNKPIKTWVVVVMVFLYPFLIAGLSYFGGLAANSITQAQIQAGAVGTAQLKTATGSASGNCNVSLAVDMNDYAFMANQQESSTAVCALALDNLLVRDRADSGTTIGSVTIPANAGPASIGKVVRWRYITASDNPSIWIVYNALGVIVATWASDDPCEPTETIPCVSVPVCVGCTTKKFKSSDFSGYIFPPSVITAATNFIQANKYNMANLPYRALQKYGALTKNPSDYAPADWIQANLKVVSGVPVLASTGLTVLP